MNNKFLRPALLTALVISALQFPACKSNNKGANNGPDSVVTDTVVKPAPVVIAGDDELDRNTKDAIKDFPGVTAEVKDGEITLSGPINREKLQRLMMSVNALHPKKVNNNLTITK